MVIALLLAFASSAGACSPMYGVSDWTDWAVLPPDTGPENLVLLVEASFLPEEIRVLDNSTGLEVPGAVELVGAGFFSGIWQWTPESDLALGTVLELWSRPGVGGYGTPPNDEVLIHTVTIDRVADFDAPGELCMLVAGFLGSSASCRSELNLSIQLTDYDLDAEVWEIQAATESGFNAPIVAMSQDAFVTIGGDTIEPIQYVRARAIDAAGNIGPWTETVAFDVSVADWDTEDVLLDSCNLPPTTIDEGKGKLGCSMNPGSAIGLWFVLLPLALRRRL